MSRFHWNFFSQPESLELTGCNSRNNCTWFRTTKAVGGVQFLGFEVNHKMSPELPGPVPNLGAFRTRKLLLALASFGNSCQDMLWPPDRFRWLPLCPRIILPDLLCHSDPDHHLLIPVPITCNNLKLELMTFTHTIYPHNLKQSFNIEIRYNNCRTAGF